MENRRDIQWRRMSRADWTTVYQGILKKWLIQKDMFFRLGHAILNINNSKVIIISYIIMFSDFFINILFLISIYIYGLP